MNKIPNKNKLEFGQMIPLVVLMLFVIIGMTALIVDGGSIMSNKRTAQAAADAGALAGAQRICMGKDKEDAETAAGYFAEQNGADPTQLSVNVNFPEKLVTVTTTVKNPSFFAKILAENNTSDTATADATAGCFYPSKADRVLPIAFYYQTGPVKAAEAICDEEGKCNLVNHDFDTLMTALDTTVAVTNPTINLPLDDIYVISNNTKVCEKTTGGFVCTEMDAHESGGNRSFLDLNDVLSKIITDGLDSPLNLPAWVNGEGGAVSAVYKASNFITNYEPIEGYEDLEVRLYFVPLFDLYCPDCFCEPTEDYDPIYCDQSNKQSYHLIGFSPFVVTCVQQGPKCEFGECVPAGDWELGDVEVSLNKEICPGLLATNPTDPQYINSIEGYFVAEFPVNEDLYGSDGVDGGAYLISLSE